MTSDRHCLQFVNYFNDVSKKNKIEQNWRILRQN